MERRLPSVEVTGRQQIPEEKDRLQVRGGRPSMSLGLLVVAIGFVSLFHLFTIFRTRWKRWRRRPGSLRLAICEYPLDIGGSGRENSCDFCFSGAWPILGNSVISPLPRRGWRSMEV